MTNEKRKTCRKISAFLTPDVTKKGNEKFGNEKFSFENLVRVERDDMIREESKNSVKKIADNKKLSRQQIYRIRSRK